MQDKFVIDETTLKRYLSYIGKARTHQDVQKQREYMQMAEDLVKPFAYSNQLSGKQI